MCFLLNCIMKSEEVTVGIIVVIVINNRKDVHAFI